MIELPDDELDKLFRKSSEELDPTFDPEDWNNLRKRLDQQDGRSPGGWWKKWWPLGVLVLLIPAGIFLYSYHGAGLKGSEGGVEDGRKGRSGVVREERNETNEKPGVVREAENGAHEKSGVVAKEEGNRVSDEGRTDKSGSLSRVVIKEDKTVGKNIGKSSSESGISVAANGGSESLPRSRSKAGGVYLEPNRSKVEGGDGALSIKKNANAANPKPSGAKTSPERVLGLQNGNEPGKPLPESRKGEVGNVGTGDAGSSSKGNAQVGNAGVSVAAESPQLAEPTRTFISASALNGHALKWNALSLPGISNPVQELPEPPKPSAPSRSAGDQPLFAVRFGYSPDLSTVGLKDYSKPGTAVSLLVEYSVLPRIFIQSGVVWSRKEYSAPGGAYKLPKIPHYYPPELKSVDGLCEVLEVPLNVRFDITSAERSRWFATGGFSSYHMNSERYDYKFVDENDPRIKYRYWKGKTGWYLLSHASLSAGYEYRVSRKLSLLAEPSIRMPLKRVGYGKVNLITTGLWLSVRYTPAFK